MPNPRQSAAENLLPDERARLILDRLRANGRVLAAELAVELSTSEHTIRRHLRDLADAGHCKRVYGGALLASPADRNAADRMREAVDRKANLAATAASIVKPGQVVLLDSGSTNVAIAAALPDNLRLTVVTNSPQACARLVERSGFDVILIGGRVAARSAGASGATALLQIQQIRADICFLGACSLDPEEGVAAFDADEAELKRAMVKASGVVAIAATSEKLMTAAPFVVAPASAVDCLIVEADLSGERLAQLRGVCASVMVASA